MLGRQSKMTSGSIPISQKDYLKKYLSGSDGGKKKKKKQKVISSSLKRSQIIDDDIDFKNMRALNDDEVDIYQLDEDAPQIAGIIDERPAEIKAKEYYNDSKRWKVFATDDDNDNIKVIDQQKNVSSVSNSKNIQTVSTEQEKEISHTHKQKIDIFDDVLDINKTKESNQLVPNYGNDSDSDQSLPRQASKYESRSRKKGNDSDLTSSRKSNPKNTSTKIKESMKFEKIKYPSAKSGSDSDLSPPRTSKLDYKKDSKNLNNSSNWKDNISKNYTNKINKRDKTNDSGSDLSPARKSYNDKNYSHKPMRRNESDSDFSPARKLYNDKKNSNKSKRRNGSDSDLSPPRKIYSNERYSENRSRPNKTSRSDQMNSRRDQSDSDLSPSRKTARSERYEKNTNKSIREDKYSDKQRNRRSSSESPSRNSKQFSYRQEYRNTHSKLPLRKSGQKEYSRGKEQNKSDSDMSPPRYSSKSKHSEYRRKKRNSDSDLSPSRNSSQIKNSEPKRNKKSSDSDLSPPRNSAQIKNSEYKRKKKNSDSESPNSKISSTSSDTMKKSKMEKTLDGKRAGLQDAKNLKKELTDFKSKEDQLFAKMNASVSGEGAAPIVRDRKTGKVRDLEEEKVINKEKVLKDDARKEKYTRWGKGLKQVEDAAERLADAMKEMSKPLARYADDEDLDKFLKAQEREGDPMLDYIKRKQGEAIALSGHKPQYQGSFTPNRFGIRPGHRWDGVDRSNGYEKKWFTQQNARKARDEEAYKWSTSDM